MQYNVDLTTSAAEAAGERNHLGTVSVCVCVHLTGDLVYLSCVVVD